MPSPQFMVDKKGNKVAVVLPMKEYKKLLEAKEELEDVIEFDKAFKRKQEFVPFEKAIEEIESSRRNKQ